MRRTKAFSTVNWRKYLDVNTNPRAKSFLESRGDDVLWQISQNIHKGYKTKQKEIILLVHPNAGAVIRITENEYDELLEMCLKWFEVRENYDICARIKFFKTNIEKIKKGLNPLKYKETLV